MFPEFQGSGNDINLPSNVFNSFVKSSKAVFLWFRVEAQEKTEFSLQLNSKPICQEMDLFYDGVPVSHLHF